MLLPKKISGVKKVFLVLVMVMIIGIIGYLIFDNFFGGSLVFIKPLEVQVDVFSAPTIEPKFDTNFLSQEPYTSFEENGQLPVTADSVGRPNPFRALPFSILE